MTKPESLHTYFTRLGIPEQQGFPLYKKGNESVVALTYTTEEASQRLITTGEYDATVKRFGQLPQGAQEIYVDQLRREPKKLYEGLNTEQRQSYRKALQEAGITGGDMDRQIIRDSKLRNGKGRNMDVYSVNGHPVFAEAMSPEIISFYKGTQTLQEAVRLNRSYTDGPEQASRYINRNHGVEPEVAASAMKKPAAQSLFKRAGPKPGSF